MDLPVICNNTQKWFLIFFIPTFLHYYGINIILVLCSYGKKERKIILAQVRNLNHLSRIIQVRITGP